MSSKNYKTTVFAIGTGLLLSGSLALAGSNSNTRKAVAGQLVFDGTKPRQGAKGLFFSGALDASVNTEIFDDPKVGGLISDDGNYGADASLQGEVINKSRRTYKLEFVGLQVVRKDVVENGALTSTEKNYKKGLFDLWAKSGKTQILEPGRRLPVKGYLQSAFNVAGATSRMEKGERIFPKFKVSLVGKLFMQVGKRLAYVLVRSK